MRKQFHVVIVGAGFSGTAITVQLMRRGDSALRLTARAHRESIQELPGDLRMSLHAAMVGGGLRQIVRAVRRTVRAASERGLTWHAVIDAMRPVTSTSWAKMGAADRQRFLRRLRPYWDVHRHRMAPGAAATIDAMLADGRLDISTGRVQRTREDGEKIVVETRARGTAGTTRQAFDRVVNCTGPDYDASSARALEQRLVARGLLTPDPFGLGYKTGLIGEVLGSNGIVPNLFLMGPACRPCSFEHTAVPELRQQADALAAELLSRRRRVRGPSGTNVLPFVRRRRVAKDATHPVARRF